MGRKGPEGSAIVVRAHSVDPEDGKLARAGKIARWEGTTAVDCVVRSVKEPTSERERAMGAPERTVTKKVLAGAVRCKTPVDPELVGAPWRGELRGRKGGVELAAMSVSAFKRVTTDTGELPRTFSEGGIHEGLLADTAEEDRGERVAGWFRAARRPCLRAAWRMYDMSSIPHGSYGARR